MRRTKITLSILLAPLLLGCAQGDALRPESVVSVPHHRAQPSELDRWIDTTFVPYGIEVSYRWDKRAVDQASYAHPPQEAKVRPVLEAVKSLWLDLYSDKSLQGGRFLLGRAPLRIYLFGGGGLDAHGLSLVSAPKPSATEMYIYNVNSFDPADEVSLCGLMHAVHHQFALRLTELHGYDFDAFRAISGNAYHSTNEYVQFVMQSVEGTKAKYGLSRYANAEGFFTLHGLLSPRADFADMISVHMHATPQEIIAAREYAAAPRVDPDDADLTRRNAEQSARAGKALAEKQRFVEDYYRKVVGVRLSEMQQRSVRLLNEYRQSHGAG